MFSKNAQKRALRRDQKRRQMGAPKGVKSGTCPIDSRVSTNSTHFTDVIPGKDLLIRGGSTEEKNGATPAARTRGEKGPGSGTCKGSRRWFYKKLPGWSFHKRAAYNAKAQKKSGYGPRPGRVIHAIN